MERLKPIGAAVAAFLRSVFGSRSTALTRMQDPIIQDVFAASTEAFLSAERAALIDGQYARALKEYNRLWND